MFEVEKLIPKFLNFKLSPQEYVFVKKPFTVKVKKFGSTKTSKEKGVGGCTTKERRLTAKVNKF